MSGVADASVMAGLLAWRARGSTGQGRANLRAHHRPLLPRPEEEPLLELLELLEELRLLLLLLLLELRLEEVRRGMERV